MDSVPLSLMIKGKDRISQHMLQIFNIVAVKFSDLFLQRNFSYLAMIMPLNFSEIFNFVRISVFFLFFENSIIISIKLP